MSHITASAITAFLYAGALQHPTRGTSGPNGADFDHWEGHTGFVFYCARYAEAIDAWLGTPERIDDDHPGVMLYELIEPMGEWLIQHDAPLETADALEHFKIEYLAWLPDVVVADVANTERIIETESFTITLDLHGERKRGYFEHKLYGEDRAGGLWYTDKDITDYDGVFELPKEVRKALIADGFTSEAGCLDD